jgi:hypothetical protein
MVEYRQMQKANDEELGYLRVGNRAKEEEVTRI